MDVSTRQWRTVSEALRDLLLAKWRRHRHQQNLRAGDGTSSRRNAEPQTGRGASGAAGPRHGDFDPYVLFERILKLAKRAGSRGSGKRVSAVADAVMSVEYPPAKSEDIEAKCPQITAIAACGGNVEEPSGMQRWESRGSVDSDAVALR